MFVGNMSKQHVFACKTKCFHQERSCSRTCATPSDLRVYLFGIRGINYIAAHDTCEAPSCVHAQNMEHVNLCELLDVGGGLGPFLRQLGVAGWRLQGTTAKHV